MEKPSDNVGIPWLLDELGDLAEHQVVSPGTVTALQDYYATRACAKQQEKNRRIYFYLTYFLAGLAALLIGGGMILILNYNWDDFSREIRAAIAIVPAAVGLTLAAWVIGTEKSRAWREFAGIWLMVTAYSSLGIIAQTYNLGGRFETFMLIVTATTLFVPVLLRSLGANFIQLINFIAWGIAITSMGWWYEESIFLHKYWICAGLLLGLIPYYLSTYANKNHWERRFDSINLVISSYFLIPILLCQFVEPKCVRILLLLTAASALLLIGRWVKLHGDRRVAKPWQVGGWLGILILSFFISTDPGHFFFSYSLNSDALLSWWLLPLFGLALYGIVCTCRKRWFAGLVGLLPLAMFVAMLLSCNAGHEIKHGNPYSMLSDLTLLYATGTFTLFSIFGLMIGYIKKDFGILNGAVAVLILAITIRFFDGDYTALTRGIVFVSVGVVTLFVNLLINLFLKKKAIQ